MRDHHVHRDVREARRMSCCAHRGVDPRPLGRSYAVVSVPLSHGHVYVVASTASKPLSYVATLISLDLTRSSGFVPSFR